MKYAKTLIKLGVVAACGMILSGCAVMTMFSYMEKGMQSDHGKGEAVGVYNDNDSCTVHGTCGGVNSCDLYGNC